jgi:hypothetical protein
MFGDEDSQKDNKDIFEGQKKTGLFGSVESKQTSNVFGRSKDESNPQFKNLFLKTDQEKAPTTNMFGSQPKFENQNETEPFTSKPQPSRNLFGKQAASDGSIGVSSIAGDKLKSNLFSSEQSMKAGRDEENMQVDKYRPSPSKALQNRSSEYQEELNSALNESIIRHLSTDRSNALERLFEIGSFRRKMVKTQSIEFRNGDGFVQEVKFTKGPNVDRALMENNFSSLQEFRNTLNTHIKMIEDGKLKNVPPIEVNLINEMNILSLVLFSMHYISPQYVPF